MDLEHFFQAFIKSEGPSLGELWENFWPPKGRPGGPQEAPGGHQEAPGGAGIQQIAYEMHLGRHPGLQGAGIHQIALEGILGGLQGAGARYTN